MALRMLTHAGTTAEGCFPKCCSTLLSRTERCHGQLRGRFGSPVLTPQQVNTILRTNEYQVDFRAAPSSSVKCFDSNQLPSNNPVEDRRAEARCLHTTGALFGVFDGHGGSACAEVISRRLFMYVASSLLPLDMLKELSGALKNGDDVKLVESYQPDGGNEACFSPDLDQLYRDSFCSFVEGLVQSGPGDGSTEGGAEFHMRDALMHVFLRLDRDLWMEVEKAEAKNMASASRASTSTLAQTLAVAMSGCVACIAHVDGPHLHVASMGDCRAVLGTLNESNTWVAKPLNALHGFDNVDEVKRVLGEHPKNESDTVLKQERLLGQLAPLRAFGDFRFKWPSSMQKRLLVPVFGHRVLLPSYYTPPYLTARPEVVHHCLLPRDKFLVLASDGLWDQLSPARVVQLVGEYMRGRQTLEPFRLPSASSRQQPRSLTLGEIADILSQRKEGLEHKPVDSNAATHLVRSALGGTEYGIDHAILSQMLSAPQDVVRLVRDDITVTIVFFNSDALRHASV